MTPNYAARYLARYGNSSHLRSHSSLCKLGNAAFRSSIDLEIVDLPTYDENRVWCRKQQSAPTYQIKHGAENNSLHQYIKLTWCRKQQSAPTYQIKHGAENNSLH
jgi:hypothetical protein